MLSVSILFELVVAFAPHCSLHPAKECIGEGWLSGESARLPPVWPGFDSRRHMWVDFVVGSHLALRGFFPGPPVFPSHQKPTFINSNSIWNARTRINEFLRVLRCYVGK